MSLFGKLTSEGLEKSQDRLGGFSPLDSGVYIAKIKALYAGQSSGGAMSITLLAELQNGKEYRETVYVTNKEGKNFFLNKDDRTKKVPLPGFTVADDLCLIATGKPLAEQDTEEKVINVYDYETKKELPKSVPMIVEAIGQEVSLGIIKQVVNKNVKQGTEYVATAETREENFIDKVFHPTLKLSVAEARNGQDEPKFQEAWIARNKDQIRDKRTIKDGEAGAASNGRPPKAGAAPVAGVQTARKSLFGG
jgi:hypothetical protein